MLQSLLKAMIAPYIPQIAEETKRSQAELMDMLKNAPDKLVKIVEELKDKKSEPKQEQPKTAEKEQLTFIQEIENLMQKEKPTIESKIAELVETETFKKYSGVLSESLENWIKQFGFEPKQTNQGVIANNESQAIHFQQLYGDFCEGLFIQIDQTMKYKTEKIYFLLKEGKAEILDKDEFTIKLKEVIFTDYKNNNLK